MNLSTSNAAKKTTAALHTRKKAVSAVEPPWSMISVLNAVCNAIARISPRAAAAARTGGFEKAVKASEKPIAEEATTWSKVDPRKRRSPVKMPVAKWPAAKGAERKSMFSAAAKPSATVSM